MERKVFTGLVAALFFYVVSPLAFPVLMGGLFAVLLMPMQSWLEKRKFSTGTASLLVTFGITLVLILPITLAIYMAAKAGFQQLEVLKGSKAHGDWVQALIQSSGVRPILAWVREWYPVSTVELQETLEDLLRSLSSRGADILGGAASSIPGVAMGVGVLVVSIYFLLIDGRSLIVFMRKNSFFTVKQTDQLIRRLESICRSVMLASLVAGTVQALFETLVAALLGIGNLSLVGAGVFLASFIPVIGAAPVTYGLALQQFFSGHKPAGIILFISAVIVTAMDNVIRPWFLKGSANLHPLLAFVAAFGGLQTLGFAGVFLGPILAGLFVASLQILSQRSD